MQNSELYDVSKIIEQKKHLLGLLIGVIQVRIFKVLIKID